LRFVFHPLAGKEPRALLYFIGRALGFDRGDGSVSSVLNDPAGDDLSAPTQEDLDALCAKYATCA